MGVVLRWVAFAAMMILAVACATTQSTQMLPAAESGPYRLGPGDEVRVTVAGLNEVNATYSVSDAGTISIPMLGTIEAKGMMLDELSGSIAAAITEKRLIRDPNPEIGVQIQKYRPFFMMGQVQRPGQYAYVPGMTVMTAVSISGGFTFRAKTDVVEITRQSNGDKISGQAGPDTPVLPGDTILVREAWF